MFRRLYSGLPEDPQYYPNMDVLSFEQTGNDSTEGNLDRHFNHNERHNQVQLEMLDSNVRKHTLLAFQSQSIVPFYLPQRKFDQPGKNQPTIPILTSEGLDQCRRVVVVVNQCNEDLGILSHRVACRDHKGTMLALANEIEAQSWWTIEDAGSSSMAQGDSPGLVIANPGQTYFSHTHLAYSWGTAVTAKSWQALPRPSGLHDAPLVDPTFNRIKYNETAGQHLRYLFSSAVLGSDLVHPEARFLIVAIGDGADELLEVLAEKFDDYGHRIKAIAMCAPSPLHHGLGVSFLQKCTALQNKKDFMELLQKRTKAWCFSDLPLGSAMANAQHYPLSRLTLSAANGNKDDTDDVTKKLQSLELEPSSSEYHLWPQVSGAACTPEGIAIKAHADMARWLAEVESRGENYHNVPAIIVQPAEPAKDVEMW